MLARLELQHIFGLGLIKRLWSILAVGVHSHLMVQPGFAGAMKVPPPNWNFEKPRKSKSFSSPWHISILHVLLIGLAIYSRYLTFHAPVEKDEKFLMMGYNFGSTVSLVLLPCFMPNKNQHFSLLEFGSFGAKFICFFEIFIAASAIHNGAPFDVIPGIFANVITSLVLGYAGSHNHLFTYHPYMHNRKFQKVRSIARNNMSEIHINDSRALEIELENRSDQAYALDGCKILRSISHKCSDTYIKFPVPEGTVIEAGKKMKFVPITEVSPMDISPISNVVGIPGYRCFGTDAGERIITTLVLNHTDVAELEEEFHHLNTSDTLRGFERVVETVWTKDGPQSVELL